MRVHGSVHDYFWRTCLQNLNVFAISISTTSKPPSAFKGFTGQISRIPNETRRVHGFTGPGLQAIPPCRKSSSLAMPTRRARALSGGGRSLVTRRRRVCRHDSSRRSRRAEESDTGESQTQAGNPSTVKKLPRPEKCFIDLQILTTFRQGIFALIRIRSRISVTLTIFATDCPRAS